MALTIRQLGEDGGASFLLSFDFITTPGTVPARPFHILLDPRGTTIGHTGEKHSRSPRGEPSGIETSLPRLLLPQPDLIIITSNAGPDFTALQQLSLDLKATLILAAPEAAKKILSKKWEGARKKQKKKHSDHGNVLTLRKWTGTARGSDPAVTRIPLPPAVQDGLPGEVTVVYMAQRNGRLGRSHAAVGITFRPPAARSPTRRRGCFAQGLLAVPDMPRQISEVARPPTAPVPPRPARLAVPTLTDTRAPDSTTTDRQPSSSSSPPFSPSSSSPPPPSQRTLSVLFSRDGFPFAGALSSYTTTHLVHEAALPLTALLHPSGPTDSTRRLGREIASRLGARCWAACHDEAKGAKGLGGRWGWGWCARVRRKKSSAEEKGSARDRGDENRRCEEAGHAPAARVALDGSTGSGTPRGVASSPVSGMHQTSKGFRILNLTSGEEVVLTSVGLSRDENDGNACS